MVKFHFLFGFADFFLDLPDESADLLDLFVAVHDRADHFRVRHFLGARFDHQNGVFGAREGEVNGALFLLREAGINHVFSVHTTDDDRAGGARPGNVGDGQRDGGTDHGDGLGRDVGIDGKRGGDHHHVVEDSLGEQGTDRTVDEAADEDRLIGRPALSLFETAGDFADGEHFFLVVDGQREEIHAFSRLFRHTYRDVYHRVPTPHEAGAVGLFRVFADFHGKFSAGIVRFEYSVIVE